MAVGDYVVIVSIVHKHKAIIKTITFEAQDIHEAENKAYETAKKLGANVENVFKKEVDI